jgi:ribonucleoside-diphosphate reductase alpha chain
MAIIQKTGGGTGFNFSNLRSKGSLVHGTGHCASGPVSFMRVFNTSTDVIKQGGKRRGANIGCLDIHHPDIEDFITCKKVEGDFENFNISVLVNDEFMKNLNDERNKKIFDLIIKGMWKNGEPGLVFLDRTEDDNTCKHLGKLIYRNPCAEVCLLKWESCNLASINLLKCIDENGGFDFEKFDSFVKDGVEFLDKMIDKNKYPLQEIDEATKKTRKIGLGIMGLADVLILLGMRYGDKKSYEFVSDLIRRMRNVADEKSKELAVKYGTYPESRGDERRNASVLSIAPTGTISLFAGVSSGMEPNTSFVYKRSTWSSGQKVTYDMLHPLLEKSLKERYDDSKVKKVLEHLVKYKTLQNCNYIDDDIKYIFVNAYDITPEDHIKMQATIQNSGVDQSISKTINCKETTSEKDISKFLKYAWEEGCKGITIYRRGSRQNVVISDKMDVNISNQGSTIPTERPDTLFGGTYSKRSGCGKLYLTVNYNENIPYEVFAFSGGSGGCQAQNEALGRLISLGLQNGVDYKQMVKQLKKVKCPVAIKNARAEGKSCADIIGDILLKSMGDDDIKEITRGKEEHIFSGMKCPDCGEDLDFVEGCRTCHTCGWSKCI